MTNYPTTYLGDGVYAMCDGYHIILELSAQEPKHRIALEPAVMAALQKYETALREFVKAKNSEPDESK